MNLPREHAVNVGLRLTQMAAQAGDRLAVVEARTDGKGPSAHRQCTFAELDHDSNQIASGLKQHGIEPGQRIVLLVPPGVDFISLFFALLKAGVVTILIDPGIGKEHLIECLSEASPDGFVAIPKVQTARRLMRRKFRRARHNVTVGKSWFFGGLTIQKLRRARGECPAVDTGPDDPAAIIFTSGSTGAPKGVLYSHGNFDRQVEEIRDRYGIQPGEVDLSAFPLFALFNAAMGVTTIIPEMDFTRPAAVDPRKIVAAIDHWKATQAFGSPALWTRVGRHCQQHDIRLPSLQRVLSAGAPVPVHVLQSMKATIAENGDLYTPYGATEALPVASISATSVLSETARRSAEGAGTCVGSRFPGIEWKVIEITDKPLLHVDQCTELPAGEIGELMVRGPVVTREYVTRTEANRFHKVRDGEHIWHRMGDVGYLDPRDRFWFCGRKSQRVQLHNGLMFTVPCEAIINQHERVYRSALVGIGDPHHQRAVVIVEMWEDQPIQSPADRDQVTAELWDLAKASPLTRDVHHILFHPSLPVDIRHNAKIFREQLAVWAAEQLRDSVSMTRH